MYDYQFCVYKHSFYGWKIQVRHGDDGDWVWMKVNIDSDWQGEWAKKCVEFGGYLAYAEGHNDNVKQLVFHDEATALKMLDEVINPYWLMRRMSSESA